MKGLLDNDAFNLGMSILGNNYNPGGELGPALAGGYRDYRRQQMQAHQLARQEQAEQERLKQEQLWSDYRKTLSPDMRNMPRELLMSQYKSGGQSKLGNQINYALGPKGKKIPYQTSNRGGFHPIALPEGHTAVQPQQFLNLGSTYQGVDKYSGQPGRSYNVMPRITDTPEHQASVVTAKETAKAATDKQITRTKTESAISSKSDKTELLTGLINEAKEDAGWWTTGLIGGTAAKIPGTPAYDLARKLDTVRANIGFDRLQEMRDNSKTGGALGQVSEMENRLLQAVWGNLEQSQSKEQFLQNLDLVEQQVEASWKRVEDAYEQDYGRPFDEQNTSGSNNTEYSQEDLEYTAKQHGITVEEVLQKMKARAR